MNKVFQFILQRSTEKTFVVSVMLLLLWGVLPIILPTSVILGLSIYILFFVTDHSVDVYTTKVVTWLKNIILK